MNTDQGNQFTGSAWVTTPTETGARVPMDGRGRCMDNIFIERHWRSLKQEAVYLTEIADGFHARRVIDERVCFYNSERPLSALEQRTPDEVFWGNEEGKKAA